MIFSSFITSIAVVLNLFANHNTCCRVVAFAFHKSEESAIQNTVRTSTSTRTGTMQNVKLDATVAPAPNTDSDSDSVSPSNDDVIPLIYLPNENRNGNRNEKKSGNDKQNKESCKSLSLSSLEMEIEMKKETSRSLVDALQNSGFLLVQSPLLTCEHQSAALEAARTFLKSKSKSSDQDGVIEQHPTDPKTYAMLDCKDIICDVDCQDTCSENVNENGNENGNPFKQYVETLQMIKMDILRHIAIGLELQDPNYFVRLHDEHNDTLRLISYHACTNTETVTDTDTDEHHVSMSPKHVGNRCKEHSDYGTITLLSTDGVSGLEIFHHGQWIPVPYIEGALVVNIGSLLSGWSRGKLKATLHRVAGPASLNSQSPKEDLLEAVGRERTSIAFFADPNKDVSDLLTMSASKEKEYEHEHENENDPLQGMSVQEYLNWRSGGSGVARSGVSFTNQECNEIETEMDHPRTKGNENESENGKGEEAR